MKFLTILPLLSFRPSLIPLFAHPTPDLASERSIKMTTLAALPTDALATITSFLGAEDIAYLCFTGDSALKLHLRHGGVVSLVLEAPIAFPRIVGQLRLRSFSIIPYSKDRYNECPTYGIDLSLLGPQLEDLCLDFNSALAKLDQLNVPFGTLFPNLKSLFLPIQPRMPTDLDVGRLLQGLPSTLLHLSLPRCAAVDIEALLSLPCHLESLEVRLGRIGDGQDRVFAESKIFDRLTKLHVTTDKKVQCFRIIPSSVLDFSWTADSAATMAPIIADDFAFIPAGLQSLFICPFLNGYLPLLQHLPRDLKYLGILSYEDLTEVNFVKTLPPSLTRLETSSVASDILAKLVSLPPRLEIWRQFRLRKEQMELKLPPNLTELCIANLDAQDFAALLPTSLRSLTVSNNSLLQDETRFTALLPSTLTKLHLVVKACSAASLRHLPPSLRKFYLKLKDFTLPSNFVDDEWKTIWPDSLERLRFLATCEVDSLGPLFWLSLPRRLRQLEIYIPDYSHMPPTMAFLPRTLIR